MATSGRDNRLVVPLAGGIYTMGKPLAYPMIRITAGLFMVPHGCQKLFGWFGGRGLDGTAQAFDRFLGLSPGWFWATAAGTVEVVGGILLVVGLLTRPAALAGLVLMLVAVFHVHFGNGYFWTKRGYEYPLMWAILMLAIFFRGSGRASIDGLIGKEF